MNEQLPKDVVDTKEGLREHYAEPAGLSVEKAIPRLDPHCRRFIELSPFMCISSAGADGSADISPKGDAPGFVQVLDDTHILIPDRRGNNRLDTLTNLTENPYVALIFFVPGIGECLRAHGRAKVVRDEEVMARFEVRGKAPTSAILVEIDECYLHCAKAIIRSKLWDEDTKVERGVLPSLGQMIKDQTQSSDKVEDLDAHVEDGYKNKLY